MQTIKDILNPNYVKKKDRGYNLKITLKKGKKGTSLYAIKPIRRGNVIAYYKFMVYDTNSKHKMVQKSTYAIAVYDKYDSDIDNLIGDLYPGSLDIPKRNIPYWAYFSNEPSPNQTENCFLDINTKSNYRNRNKVKAGDTMVYKLVAKRDIKPGDEITWCYSSTYHRNYKVNCS